IDVEKTMSQSQNLKQDIAIEVSGFWPDFRLSSDGTPETASTQSRNPAVQLLLSQGDIQETWYVFSNPEFPAIRSGHDLSLETEAIAYRAPVAHASDFFRVIVGPNQELYYAAASSNGFKSGPLQVGEPIVPGWADFQITLLQVLDRAQIQRIVVPVSADEASDSPALRIGTPDGQEHWLPWGEPQTIDTLEGNYFAAFSPKVLRLPFQVALNDFIVERNEGSESVAMWTSDISVKDELGIEDRRRVWMNHPTWFRGWKLAQASWNPGDLSQSTLQLKREPWWVTALTWIGSGLVTIGIGTMFYGRAIAKRLKFSKSSKTVAPDSDNTSEQAAPA
ncbi:MAG: cytochrome c biogenesis protein ResB, partial [Cyanobacteria bacterium P01_F01_bin.42]